MDIITIFTFILGILTFGFTVATFWNQLANQIVEVSVRSPSYYDYDFGNNHYTEVSVWIDNRGDSNLTVRSVEYYYQNKIVPKGIPDSPIIANLAENIIISPGSHTPFGNTIPLNIRPDTLVIKFNKRISMFSKTLSVDLKKDKNVNNA